MKLSFNRSTNTSVSARCRYRQIFTVFVKLADDWVRLVGARSADRKATIFLIIGVLMLFTSELTPPTNQRTLLRLAGRIVDE